MQMFLHTPQKPFLVPSCSLWVKRNAAELLPSLQKQAPGCQGLSCAADGKEFPCDPQQPQPAACCTQSPPVCLAVSHSLNLDMLFQRHDRHCYRQLAVPINVFFNYFIDSPEGAASEPSISETGTAQPRFPSSVQKHRAGKRRAAAPPGVHPRTAKHTWLNLMSQPEPKASEVKRGTGLLPRHSSARLSRDARAEQRWHGHICSPPSPSPAKLGLVFRGHHRHSSAISASDRAACGGLGSTRWLCTAAGSGRWSSSSKQRLVGAERLRAAPLSRARRVPRSSGKRPTCGRAGQLKAAARGSPPTPGIGPVPRSSRRTPAPH